MEIIEKCPHCGSNEIEYIQQDVHRKATCKTCGKFIKFVAQFPPTLWFGKYNGTPIAEITDKQYLTWLIEKSSIKINSKIIEAILIRLQQL